MHSLYFIIRFSVSDKSDPVRRDSLCRLRAVRFRCILLPLPSDRHFLSVRNVLEDSYVRKKEDVPVSHILSVFSIMHQRADIFALHHLFQVAVDVHVEDINGQVVLFAHGGGGEVHDLEPLVIDLIVSDI